VKNCPSEIFDTERFKIKKIDEPTKVSISNAHVELSFDDKTGFLEQVEMDGKSHKLNIGMFK